MSNMCKWYLFEEEVDCNVNMKTLLDDINYYIVCTERSTILQQ